MSINPDTPKLLVLHLLMLNSDLSMGRSHHHENIFNGLFSMESTCLLCRFVQQIIHPSLMIQLNDNLLIIQIAPKRTLIISISLRYDFNVCLVIFLYNFLQGIFVSLNFSTVNATNFH